MNQEQITKFFQTKADEIMSMQIPNDQKIAMLTDAFCSVLGHMTALMFFLDHNFYANGSAGLECLCNFTRDKIRESAKTQIERFALLSTNHHGSA